MRAVIRHMDFTTPDGVRIAVQETGDPSGPELVFIHGVLGSHLDWLLQIDDPWFQRFRMSCSISVGMA